MDQHTNRWPPDKGDDGLTPDEVAALEEMFSDGPAPLTIGDLTRLGADLTDGRLAEARDFVMGVLRTEFQVLVARRELARLPGDGRL